MGFEVKDTVKGYYGNIAKKVEQGARGCCCGDSSCCDPISTDIYDIEDLRGLPREAVQASLGCANPLVFAELREGEHVLDLGSGGGIDVLRASQVVGATGKVYGLDMTEEMLALANKNKERMKAANVEFIKGYIEDIPLQDECIDAVISNCVINLSEDKEKAMAEAFRVLKSGGRLAIADIVAIKDVPPAIRKQAELWCACVAGTISPNEYRDILSRVGFHDIEIIPVHVYTREVIANLAPGGTDPAMFALVDGAFAGAQIRARK